MSTHNVCFCEELSNISVFILIIVPYLELRCKFTVTLLSSTIIVTIKLHVSEIIVALTE